jgi:hypothetical protein
MPATPKFREFKRALHNRCPQIALDDWRYQMRRHAHVLDLGDGLLYVRSNRSQGWWGITKTVYSDLKRSGRNWHLILLVRDGEEGYLLADSQLATVPGSSENEASYVLHEDQDTSSASHFHSFNELFSKLGL